jgi:hypothetical protein
MLFQSDCFQGNGYAISGVEGSIMSISDTCFIDNNFVGDGTVVHLGVDGFTSSNNYGTADAGLECPFASVGSTCVPYESATCQVNENVAPAPNPTATVEAPTAYVEAQTPAESTSGSFPIKFGVSLLSLLLSFAL